MNPKHFKFVGLKWQMAASAAVSGMMLYSTVPVIFPHWARKYHQYYNITGEAAAVDEHTLVLLESLLEEMKMPHQKEAKIDLFVSCREPEFHGSFSTKRQVLIGIPAHFNWKSRHDIEESNIVTSLVTSGDPNAELLCDNLILSDDEKQFVLGRQLGYVDSHHFWVTTIQKVCAAAACYALYQVGVIMSGLHVPDSRIPAANVRVGVIMWLSVTLCSFVYSLLNDSYFCYLDKYADKYAGTINPRLAQAGISYYRKIMNCNRASRVLDSKLKNKYTASGNLESGLIRMKSLPLSMRIQLLKQLSEQPTVAKSPA